MSVACTQGHTECTQLLSSYGASRSFSDGGQAFSAERVATNSNHHDVLAWLVSSHQWSTSLHHLTVLTAARACALLRAGADMHAAAALGGPTPLSLARAKRAACAAPDGSPAGLVLAAVQPWMEPVDA